MAASPLHQSESGDPLFGPLFFPLIESRSDLPTDQATAAGCLDDAKWTGMDAMLQEHLTEIGEGMEAQILREVVHHDVERIGGVALMPARDIAECSTALIAQLRTDVRGGDYARAETPALAAAERPCMPCPVPLPDRAGRALAATLRKLCEMELSVIDDGEDPIHAAWSLLAQHSLVLIDGLMPRLIHLPDAIEAATEGMACKVRTTGALALNVLGDVPLERLVERGSGVMVALSRLPQHHGRAHGRNLYKQAGTIRTKDEEVERADPQDTYHYADYHTKEGLSVAQKRAELAELLSERITHSNLGRHLDRLHRSGERRARSSVRRVQPSSRPTEAFHSP